LYGIVIDIGTTMLTMALFVMKTGEKAAEVSRLNPQYSYAKDVISRIRFAGNDTGLDALQTVLLNAVGEMADEIIINARISPGDIGEAVYCGNTAMLHIIAGVSPKTLGTYPYTSQFMGGLDIKSQFSNLNLIKFAYVPPVISAFIGADITSGVLACRLRENGETALFIDIGTNSEMIISCGGRLAAASAAAGPAFEGVGISCGGIAAQGAICDFQILYDNTVAYQVIGGGEPKHICGSGLICVISELLRTGAIDATGAFTAGEKSYSIAKSISITQNDIRQVQLAKGAIRCGLEILLRQFDLTAGDVEKVYIAGAFGEHLNERGLFTTGMLPQEFKGKVAYAGNTSIKGGAMFLRNADYRNEFKQIADKIKTVDLANDGAFEELFIGSLDFPAAKNILIEIYETLFARYGDLRWWPAKTPFEVIIGAVLTQNTAWANVETAIKNLGDNITPEIIEHIDIMELSSLIRPAGYYNQKAVYLKAVTAWFKRYDYNLEIIRQKPLSEMRDELLSVKGVGPETADSILLYAFGFKTFVIDAYTIRLCKRFPIDAGKGYKNVKTYFEDNLPKDAAVYNNFHALIVINAKDHCKTKPVCSGCPLDKICEKRTVMKL